jgi:hypothetical protein
MVVLPVCWALEPVPCFCSLVRNRAAVAAPLKAWFTCLTLPPPAPAADWAGSGLTGEEAASTGFSNPTPAAPGPLSRCSKRGLSTATGAGACFLCQHRVLGNGSTKAEAAEGVDRAPLPEAV